MHNHEPSGYRCPFCRNLAEGAADHPLEILHRDDHVFVKMNPRWRPTNPGALLVGPIDHHENVYDLPPELGDPMQRAMRASALALKAAFGCDGVTIRQNNEPAGGQAVWHLHVHVVPRWEGDRFSRDDAVLADESDLRRRAELLRSVWPTE